jgi:hypothetical protein
MAIIKKTKTKYWKTWEKNEPFYTVAGNINLLRHDGNQYGDSLKN